jgi:hypothetical protein
MTRTLLISATIVTFACSHNAEQSRTQNDTSRPAASAQPGSGSTTERTAAAEKVSVTLVGCLEGTAQPRAAGTAGSLADDRARDRATGNTAGDQQAHGAAANAHFTLTNATVESGALGANGAGGSGGPLLSPGSSVDLDGVPADAQSSVNKQVRVTGRLDATQAGATTGGSGRAAPANSGTTGSGASTSPRDDVRANSTTIASGVHDNGSSRHLTVETVEVIAQGCTAR